MTDAYPGTKQHQALLNCIVNHYQNDDRVLAICLFGSLARGNWDNYSDLDLDIVVADGTEIDVMAELKLLCDAFQAVGEQALIIVPSHHDEGDIVLQSLAELSIRYHVLATASPNIIDDLRLLTGRLSFEAIQAAGAANRTDPRSVTDYDTDRVLRWALEVNIRVRRHDFWQAIQLMDRIRSTLVEIFAWSRGYHRPFHAFDAEASVALQTRLGATFPQYSLESIQTVLSVLLDVIEYDLESLSDGQLHLSTEQRTVIAKVRERIRTT